MRPVYEGMRPHRSSDKQGCISDTVWTIMEHCWDHEPARRPLAAEVAFCMRNEHSSAALGLTVRVSLNMHQAIANVILLLAYG
jgi:hypothetical protein